MALWSTPRAPPDTMLIAFFGGFGPEALGEGQILFACITRTHDREAPLIEERLLAATEQHRRRRRS